MSSFRRGRDLIAALVVSAVIWPTSLFAQSHPSASINQIGFPSRMFRLKLRRCEEKVLERLATSDKTTIVIERQPDGKMRVASGSWDGEKVFLKDEVLKVRHAIADAGLHVARKTKAPDDWDPPYESYDPMVRAA
jgi:hypothetical protein